ncbi:ABC transporter ATP-binding protein [Eubacteriaceae bacterium ES2]|nr:ABC transporter ATP-binding protein [Eubacteriaceae bacterium ES2]
MIWIKKLEFINVSKDADSEHGIRDLNFFVPECGIYALYARNRITLSHVLKLAAGLKQPDYGDIRLFGDKLTKKNQLLLNKIGLLPEPPAFYPNLSVADNLKLLAMLRPRQVFTMTEDAINLLDIWDYRKLKAASLDTAQKKRLGLAIALMHNPELLILNDPFSGLNSQGIKEISKLFSQLCHDYGKTILLTSNNLDDVESIADCIAYMENGSIIQEFSRKEREKINQQYICVVADHVSAIIPIIESQLNINQFDVIDDQTMRIYDLTIGSSSINGCLNQNSINVKEIYYHQGTLQEYLDYISRGL